MFISRCSECNGLKYNARGKSCPVCGGTGFITISSREDNLEREKDRRVRERRKNDRRNNYRRLEEKELSKN